MVRSAQLAHSAGKSHAGAPDASLTDARSVAAAWLDARARCDLDRLATLTGSRAVWHTSGTRPTIGRGAVLQRVRSEFTNRGDHVPSVLALYAAPIVVLALTSEGCGPDDGRKGSLRTFFLRIDGDRVVEVWSTPSADFPRVGHPHEVAPTDAAAGRRRRRIVRELAV